MKSIVIIALFVFLSTVSFCQIQVFEIPGLGEEEAINTFSFTSGGDTLFLTLYQDWDVQFPYLFTNGELQSIPPIDSLYNGAISPSGYQIIYTRNGDEKTTFMSTRKGETWGTPIELRIKNQNQIGYFHWFDESIIYFYIEENGGDLAVGTLVENSLKVDSTIAGLNTIHTEFSPYVDHDLEYLLFTRYKEGDPQQQGIMYSENIGVQEKVVWAKPRIIEEITYGWSAFVHNEKLHYTDGHRILSIPISQLSVFNQ